MPFLLFLYGTVVCIIDMKLTIRLMGLLVAICVSFFSIAQDANTLMDEGQKAEAQLKDSAALEKYTAALQAQPSSLPAAVKCAEISCAIGARQTNANVKKTYYTNAKNYADAALRIDPQSADANYITAVVYGKLTEIEDKNDKMVEDVKNVKLYVDKALSINPNHGKAWNVIGKWHYEMLTLNLVKKAAVKVLYGGLPKSNIEDCIAAYEKCKTLEPYYCRNYLDLAKAYNYNKQYEKALATLQQCTKCPNRQQDDPALKQEAKELLVKWQ
jgi:tetratricopeptide (TPR) repeat protein